MSKDMFLGITNSSKNLSWLMIMRLSFGSHKHYFLELELYAIKMVQMLLGSKERGHMRHNQKLVNDLLHVSSLQCLAKNWHALFLIAHPSHGLLGDV